MLEMAVGICLIIFAGGLVNWVNIYLSRRPGKRAAAADADTAQRLAELERRLTDVKDVMLALSDKLDRWDKARG